MASIYSMNVLRSRLPVLGRAAAVQRTILPVVTAFTSRRTMKSDMNMWTKNDDDKMMMRRFYSSKDDGDNNNNNNNENASKEKSDSAVSPIRRPPPIKLPPIGMDRTVGGRGGGRRGGRGGGRGGGGRGGRGGGRGGRGGRRDRNDERIKEQRRQQKQQKQQQLQMEEEQKKRATLLRPHEISLFPGNYSDDLEDMDNNDDHYNNNEEDYNSDEEEEKKDEEELADAIQRLEYEEQKQQKKWMENSQAPIRTPQIDERTGRSYGKGGRKAATARVWIQPGFGNVVVNRRNFIDYFDRETDREHLLEPMIATNTCGLFDVICYVNGGGLTGQAGAVRLGLANALTNYNPTLYRPPLKELGLLTRDSRIVERKKVGHVKARKKRQWIKR